MATLNDIETKIQSIITILYSRIVKTITGTLPLTFTTHTAGNAVDWVIMGNDLPGTEQLFDKSASTSDKVVGNNGVETTSYGRSHSDYIPVTTGLYYVSNILPANQFYQIVGFDENKQFTKIYNFTPLSYTTISGVVNVEETTKYIIINYQSTNENDVSVIRGSTAPDHYIPYQQGVGEQRVDGYHVPLTISQAGHTDKTVDIFIGDTPLTAGQSVSKTSTGVDLELFEGENTVSTTLYNKPEMTIKYKYNGGN